MPAHTLKWLEFIASQCAYLAFQKVFQLDGKQFATDGHLAVIADTSGTHLPLFPRADDVRDWLRPLTLEPSVSVADLQAYTNPVTFGCPSCGHSISPGCIHIPQSYGIIDGQGYNRTYVSWVVANVPDGMVRLQAIAQQATTKERYRMLRLDGETWRMVLMPLRVTADDIPITADFEHWQKARAK